MAERGTDCQTHAEKAKADGKDLYQSLLNLRSTPLEDIRVSPAQLLMGRRMRTRLPTTSQMLQPQMVTSTVQQLFEARQQKQKEYFDQGARALQKLEVGDNVRIWQEGLWNPAQVTGLSDQPRSYEGQVYRSNRNYQLPTVEGITFCHLVVVYSLTAPPVAYTLSVFIHIMTTTGSRLVTVGSRLMTHGCGF